MINVGSDFSGVGAFNQALIRLGIPYKEVFACDIDKFARQTYALNYGEPDYFPENVYDRDIPKYPLDIYMTSPPCQSFSLAGKRLGENDNRGILFYNSHEFIQVNKPRYFIFENVKGLLSDDKGNTFAKWVQYLGGKSVNGQPTIFPHEESVPYHLYWRVLNAKNYGIPQNRDRVFLVGIRDDKDNSFSWPMEQYLDKRLRDVLEKNVDEKYYLSDEMLSKLVLWEQRNKEAGNGFGLNIKTGDDVCNTIPTGSMKSSSTYIKGYINQDTQASQVYSPDGIGQTLCAGSHGYANGYVSVKSNTKIGYELLKIGEDSLNFKYTKSKTRRGRVGVGVSQTLETDCQIGVIQPTTIQIGSLYENNNDAGRIYSIDGISCTLKSEGGGGGAKTGLYKIGFRIRRLTPRECFRLMDFPDTFTWNVSDTQAYKQAGNSIAVGVLAGIISKLNLNK